MDELSPQLVEISHLWHDLYTCCTLFPVMTSSRLIRLQKPSPPSSDTIWKKRIGLSKQFWKNFPKIFFWLPVQKFFHFRSNQTTVISGINFRFPLAFFHSELGLAWPSISPKISFFEPGAYMTHHDVIGFEQLKLNKNPKTNNCKKNFEIPLNPAKEIIIRFARQVSST